MPSRPVRVTGVSGGIGAATVVMTPMSAWYWGRDDIGGPFLNTMPLYRWATEADCARPFVFLLPDAASMISGVCLPVDGRFTLV